MTNTAAWAEPRNWYWTSGTAGWLVFMAVCLRALWISRKY